MGEVTSRRRAALDGLSRLLDATAPEELFTGPEEDALFLYDLLVETTRARRSSYYWEICRTARRRGVTPEYVVDRAAVLLATIEERRRTDLYRILGVPPLASPETIRQRYLDLARRHHPDAGGDGALFRRAKEAYEILRDPGRRTEYERFWLRALGPFERVAAHDDVALIEADVVRSRPAAPAAPAPAEGTEAVLARLRTLLAGVRAEDLEAARADITGWIGRLETVREELAAVAALKRALRA